MANLLARREGPQELVHFVRVGMEIGYDRAFRQCYGIDGVAELERQWQANLAEIAELPHEVPSPLIGRIQSGEIADQFVAD